MIGHRLGPYEITAALGAGGMGEVFRARDTKLDRDVAIKAPTQSPAQYWMLSSLARRVSPASSRAGREPGIEPLRW